MATTDTTTAIRTLAFTVPGRPVPKARMTQKSTWTPRARKSLGYQNLVKLYASQAARKAGLVPRNMRRGDSVFTAPVQIDCVLYIAKQRGVPDPDNVLKSILDGLQPEIIRDDNVSRVPAGSWRVEYGCDDDKQRAEVTITEIPLDNLSTNRQTVG